MVQGTRFTFRLTPVAAYLGAVMVLLIPLKWLLAWFFSSAVHECGHCLALWICGKPIESICVDAGGAKIQSDSITDWQTIFCAISGPVVSLFLLLFSDVYPRLAICALMQSIYNLLPVFPLDGGRALQSLANIIFSNRFAQKFCAFVELVCIGSIVTAVLYFGVILHSPVSSALFALLFVINIKKIKIPCKYMSQRVQ